MRYRAVKYGLSRLLLAGLAAVAALPLAPAAQASPVRNPLAGSLPLGGIDHQVHTRRFCGDRTFEYVDNRQLIVRNDVYERGVFQCVTLHGDGFTITNSYRRLVKVHGKAVPADLLVGSFADVQVGCNMWGVCTSGSVRPLRVSELRSLQVSVTTRFAPRAGQQANDAADDWFTGGKLDGPASNRAELMLWLKWRGILTVTTWVRTWHGVTWDLQFWVTHETACLQGTRNNVCLKPVKYRWNYLQARITGQHSSLRHYSIMPMIRFFERRGLIRTGWTLSSLDWGFECWHACRDDAVHGYRVAVNEHVSPAP